MHAETYPLLLWLVPLLLLAGAVAGLLAGLLGVGGGIVIVPALYYIFGYLDVADSVRMHVAVGTSLATIIPTSWRSLRAHHRQGNFDLPLFRYWAPAMVVGVLAGTVLATLAAFSTLTAIFATVALLVSLYMAFGRPGWQIASQLPRGPGAWSLAAIIGAVSAMMGIGGGTMAVPTLSLFGVPIHRAVGTAAGFGMVIAVPGTLGFVLGGWNQPALPPFSLGYVNGLAFVLIVPTTVLLVPAGARLAHALSTTALRRAFAVFLGFTALRMIADILGQTGAA